MVKNVKNPPLNKMSKYLNVGKNKIEKLSNEMSQRSILTHNKNILI